MLKKLRLKFVLTNMAIVTAMLLVIFGLNYQFTKTNLDNQSANMLRSLAQSTLQAGRPTNQTTDIRLPYFTLQINTWGDVLAQGSGYFDLTDEAFLTELIRQVYSSGESMGMIEGHSLRYYHVFSPGNQCLVFVDISSHQASLASLVRSSILLGVVSLIAFLLISLLLARWAVKPVQTAWQQQRQFVSDASHELKTPLTVIMSNAELLQSDQCSPEEKTRFTGNIVTMSHQMRALVEGLLELARVDNGQVRKASETLDYSKLVSDALLPFEPVFFEQGLGLHSEIEVGISLNGNGQYLRQVADILLDNARKYSSSGAVLVTLKRQGRSCLLTVENPGTPIDKEDLKRIFERFYRTDKARSRTGSFGLGLSIARSIVQEHHGAIWAESLPEGNRFCVQLPCIS